MKKINKNIVKGTYVKTKFDQNWLEVESVNDTRVNFTLVGYEGNFRAHDITKYTNDQRKAKRENMPDKYRFVNGSLYELDGGSYVHCYRRAGATKSQSIREYEAQL